MKIDFDKFNMRPFDYTDLDYRATVEIVNQAYPNDPSTVEIWKHDDNNSKANAFERRFIGEMKLENDNQIVAVGFITEWVWARNIGKYYISICIENKFKGQGLEQPVYDYLLTALSDKEPNGLVIGSKEDDVARIKFLKKQDFKQTMRITSSELVVSHFDFSPFIGYIEKVSESGIAIESLSKLQASDINWMQKLYDLEMSIKGDIPNPDEFTPEGLEEYSRNFDRFNFRADAWFVAVDGDNYVGMSTLWPKEVLKELMSVGITGVLPSHRRRGIGTALKIKTIEYAKANGVHTIETNNEENNSMYTLNLNLGFKPRPAGLTFEKVL